MSLLLLLNPALTGERLGDRRSSARGTDEVLISERGGTNPRRVPVLGPVMSWEVSNAGMFSAFARLDDLRDVGYGGNLKGCWIEYVHSTAGRWCGEVMVRPVTDGVAEIAAMSWPVLLRGRVLAIQQRPLSAPAGALIRRVLTEATRSEPTFLSFGQIDEDGPSLSLTWGQEDVFLDLLPLIAADSGAEWRVTADRVFEFGRTLGRDLSASVRLVEGRHIASYRTADDLWMVQNRLVGIGADAEIEDRTRILLIKGKKGKKRQKKVTVRDIDPKVSATVEDAESVRVYRPIEGVRHFSDTRSRSVIEARLRQELAVTAEPAVPVELSVVDADHIFAKFTEHDTVSVVLGSAGVSGTMRVVIRSLDSGVMRVAGDLTPD